MAASLYVHVPFCVSRCAYCAFYSGEPPDLLPGYPSLVARELALRPGGGPWATLYLGGGTPSLLGARGVAELVEAAARPGGLARDAEVTVEVNPGDDVSFADLHAAGVTRVSVGVQSLEDSVLRRLGRRHAADDALRTVASASAAGLRTSADLVFGLEGLDPSGLAAAVRRLRAAGAEHGSTYSLEVHPGTPLAKEVAAGRPAAAPAADEEAQWAALDEALRSCGYEPYEVSNYSLPGAEARHNLAYWDGNAYLGLGPGAHSYDPAAGRWGARSWNDPGLRAYAEAVDAGRLPPGGREELTRREALLEALFLRLRRPKPLDFGALAQRFGAEPPRARLDQAVREGLLTPWAGADGTYLPSARGVRAADGLAAWLLEGFLPE